MTAPAKPTPATTPITVVEPVGSVLSAAGASESDPAHPWLSNSEVTRLLTITSRAKARSYLAAHLLLRRLAAEVVGGGAGGWRYVRGPGQPTLTAAGGSRRLNVSLAHSTGWVAAALSTDASVRLGIDVEDLGPEAKDHRSRHAEQLRTWVRTEAALKALGRGIAAGPSGPGVDPADVLLSPADQPPRLLSLAGDRSAGEGLHMLDLGPAARADASAGWIGALAWRRAEGDPR